MDQLVLPRPLGPPPPRFIVIKLLALSERQILQIHGLGEQDKYLVRKQGTNGFGYPAVFTYF